MRPVAAILAEARQAVATGAQGDSAPRPDRESLPGARRRRCDFAELLERLNAIEGLERIRFASPHPRHVTPRMIEAMRDLPKVCRHLHLPVQSGSTRVLAAMRRRYTREELPAAGRRPPRGHAGHRALDRYDRRVPRRDGRGLRRDAVADARRPGITACSRSSTRRGRTRSRSSACRTTWRRRRRRGGSWRSRRCRGTFRGSFSRPWSARSDARARRRASAAAGTGSCRDARAGTRS